MTDTSKLSALFDKLGNDDAYRARLQADPAGALGELGIEVPPGMQNQAVTLPSKEHVKANSASLMQQAQEAPKAQMVFLCLK
jgi:putative modified peptide